jgi:hypothetical protein
MEDDEANRWPSYSFTFHEKHTFIPSTTRLRQRRLIYFSLDAKIGSAWDSQMKAVVKGVGMR